ncbi:MAG: asparagine synthase-related protein [Gemmatimonadaceae bacterium]
MLAFGALVDLSLAPLTSDVTARLRLSLPAIPGRVSTSGHGEVALAHLADVRPLAFDTELPLTDGDLLVAGTLRIDARDALRAALSPDDPRRLEDASDARLVALAYRRWNDRLAEHLLGDYAFIVWDRTRRRLVCARDPHGNRPLLWGRVGSVVVVGSSIDVVRSLPGISAELHERALVELLREGVVEEVERTVFRDVRSLRAAHTLVFDGTAAPVVRRHWDFPVPSPIRYRRDADYVAHFREVLASTLRDRLRADRASILLSGGMDSTTLAVAAQQAMPDVALRAFTFTSQTLAPSDDDTLSVEVAARLGIAQELLDLDGPLALSHLDDPAALTSQPFDEPELVASRVSSAAVAAFAPIAIFGEDGDTLLQAPTLLNQLRTQPLAEVVGSWLRHYARTGRRPWVGLEWRDRLRRWRQRGEPAGVRWLRAAAHRVAPVASPPDSTHPLRPRSVRLLSAPLWDSLYESLSPATTLAPVLYTFPLVDPRLLAFVFAIPPVPWGQDKHLFRVAMRDELPAAVLARPKTPLDGFFEARVAQWRAAGGADTPISDRVAPWVDIAAVREVFRSGTPYEVIDAWRVLQVDRWLAREESRRA